MNWVAFAVTAWIALGLQLGLGSLLEQRFGAVAVGPAFVMPLAVFIAMGAAPAHAAWACLVLGLILDLCQSRPTSAGGVLVVVGPEALGYILAGQFVLSMRSMMIRRNPLSLAVLTVFASILASLVVVAAFSVRAAMGDVVVWHPWRQLLGALGTAVYTGLAAIPMAFVLVRLSPWFGFNLGLRAVPRRAYERR